ncbi:hypothetical protein W824_15105 [Clavibacter cf. michiganensis LMG 26808]|nr:hypothetical protein W824_15105 [Clavibacter cf. michiganensis LMG 26808]
MVELRLDADPVGNAMCVYELYEDVNIRIGFALHVPESSRKCVPRSVADQL